MYLLFSHLVHGVLHRAELVAAELDVHAHLGVLASVDSRPVHVLRVLQLSAPHGDVLQAQGPDHGLTQPPELRGEYFARDDDKTKTLAWASFFKGCAP